MTTVRRRARHGRRWLALPLLGTLLTGCGIRATQVPTDFGPAPSRVPCSLTGSGQSPQQGVPVQVFLLCGSSLVTVDRTVRVPEGTPDARRRVMVAQGLLDQLATAPSSAERSAGYATYVPGGLSVSGPAPHDPEDTLRLSTAPSRLPSAALAQLVCTLSDSAATEGDGSITLGGPSPAPLSRYACTDDVRNHPGTTAPPASDVPEETG
ncbi:hypothetical protein [Streptomyces sp. LaBMicrA B280]|uniref:hypothetical protein n=1 Tax=Streptomyces sp. LaBMicrA B280 TaxID=3391001 RepID=UPI003BA7B5CB